NTLRRRLNEKGFLATTDTARGKLTVRKTLQGERRDVLHVVWPGGASAPQAGPTGPEGDASHEGGPEGWADSWAGNGRTNGIPTNGSPLAGRATGPVGRKGRSDTGEEPPGGEVEPEQQGAGWGEWQ